MSIEINIDYTLSPHDQNNNTVGKVLGLDFEVFDINLTVEYGGYFVPITKDQSDSILNVKPFVIDSEKLSDIIADNHTDNDQEDYRS